MDAFHRFKLDQQQREIISIETDGVVATKLKTPVEINGVQFDGSTDITIAAGASGVVDNLGGHPLELIGVAAGDILEFNLNKWQNKNKSTISDGGNF